MAFMMPVVKNDWDIYKSNRSKKTSESSPVGSPTNTSATRSRKISECRSEGKGSLATSLKLEVPFPKHHSVPERMSAKQYSRQRACSDTLPSRAKVSFPREKSVSNSVNNIKGSQSWLDKLKKFMKSRSEEERTKS